MATPSTAYTTISVLESTDSAQSVELSIQREYTITHTGLTKAGAAGLEPVMLSLATAAFSYAGGNDQYILQRGDSVIIGPMVDTPQLAACRPCVWPPARTNMETSNGG